MGSGGYNERKMDAGTSAAVIAGITVLGKPAAELVKDFVGRVFGPTADAVGTAVADPFVQFNKRRALRSEHILLESAKLLAERGHEPKAVPDAILLPLLNHSSLVDDEHLQRLWAQLLASAASEDSASKVRPAFPQILSEMTYEEAHLFKHIWEHGKESNAMSFHVDEIVSSYGSFYDSTLQSWEYYLMFDNLCRLRLIELHPQISGRAVSDAMGALQRGYDATEARITIEPGVDDRLFLTVMGEEFMEACLGPADSDAPTRGV